MKAKYIITIAQIILLLLLFSSCQEAELPQINTAKVKVFSEWKDYSFHFSAEIQKPENVKVQEQGFVLFIPEYSDGMYWYDERKETIVLPDAATFEYYTKKENLKAGLEYKVYAYVKTNFGNFRSEEQVIRTPQQQPPHITSIRHIPGAGGPYKGGGKIYIEGTGFTNDAKRVGAKVINDGDRDFFFWETYPLQVEEVSLTHLILSYPIEEWRRIGKFALTIRIGDIYERFEDAFIVEGAKVESIEPSEVKYGEMMRLKLSGFSKEQEFSFAVWVPGYNNERSYQVYSVTDNEISLRMFPITNVGTWNFRYLDDQAFLMTNSYNVQEAKTSWQLLETIEETNWRSYQYNCAYKEKLYVYSSEKEVLLCYNPQTGIWERYPLDYSNGYCERVDLFGIDEYIYGAFQMIYRDQENRSIYKQHWGRFNINSKKWEYLKDIAEDESGFIPIDYMYKEKELIYVYSEAESILYEYNPHSDYWRRSLTLQDEMTMIGEYHNYIYCRTKNGDALYRFPIVDPQKMEFVRTLELNMVGEAFIKNDYLYYRFQCGIFSICLSRQDYPLEAMGGLDLTYYNYGAIFSSFEDLYYMASTHDTWGTNVRIYRYLK